MLIDRVLADLDIPRDGDNGGNPIRGSRLGRCARQSAYMMWPDAFPPEPLPARTRLVFKFGDMVHEFIRAEFRRVVPGQFGMEEERFHFKVPLTIREAEAAAEKFKAGELEGTVRWSEWARGPAQDIVHRRGRPVAVESRAEHVRGLWLNLAEPALYVPLHVDGIVDTGLGLGPVEIKSMTTAGFRYALAGKLDYSYRVQLAVAVDGTQCDCAIYIAVRKDTSHAAEIIYSRKVDAIKVTFTKQGQFVRAATLTPGEETAMDDWEAAQVEHPFEPDLLDEARARVKRILLATPLSLPPREHLPSFTCANCQGTGTQSNAKNTGLPLKKGPKPCDECEPEMVGTIPFVRARASGQLAEAELPWQCRYCAFLPHCWGEAKPALKFDRDAKPHFWVTRAAYEGMGL